MPLDSGERTGVKQSLRPTAVAVSSVSLAMYAEPLSDNHSTGCAALLIPNRRSTQAIIRSRTISPEMPAEVASQPITSRSQASIAKHTHDLTITTGELEVIGTPADVRAQCNHDAVMRAPWRDRYAVL